MNFETIHPDHREATKEAAMLLKMFFDKDVYLTSQQDGFSRFSLIWINDTRRKSRNGKDFRRLYYGGDELLAYVKRLCTSAGFEIEPEVVSTAEWEQVRQLQEYLTSLNTEIRDTPLVGISGPKGRTLSGGLRAPFWASSLYLHFDWERRNFSTFAKLDAFIRTKYLPFCVPQSVINKIDELNGKIKLIGLPRYPHFRVTNQLEAPPIFEIGGFTTEDFDEAIDYAEGSLGRSLR